MNNATARATSGRNAQLELYAALDPQGKNDPRRGYEYAMSVRADDPTDQIKSAQAIVTAYSNGAPVSDTVLQQALAVLESAGGPAPQYDPNAAKQELIRRGLLKE
jgi:hypothetical protein